MVNHLRSFTTIAALLLAASACDCFIPTSGTLTIRTDCEGDPSDTELEYVELGALSDLTSEFDGVSSFMTCEEDPDALCTSKGYGVQESGAIALGCGPRLQVAKLLTLDASTQVYFYCDAPMPIGDGTLWPMTCEYVNADGSKATGPGGAKSCQAVTAFAESEAI